MPIITRHISCTIDYLLSKTDKELEYMFDAFGKEIREELEKRKTNGERLIGAVNCEGFCPVNGCPGHEEK